VCGPYGEPPNGMFVYIESTSVRVPYSQKSQRYHARTTLSFEKPTVMTAFPYPNLILKYLPYKRGLTGVRLDIGAQEEVIKFHGAFTSHHFFA
jgi:hypothetical protein